MADERYIYELTHRAFDRLESQGIEITEWLATVVRCTAAQMADLLALMEDHE